MISGRMLLIRSCRGKNARGVLEIESGYLSNAILVFADFRFLFPHSFIRIINEKSFFVYEKPFVRMAYTNSENRKGNP